MNDGNENIVWSDRLCEVIREIAAEVVREENVFTLCRQIVGQVIRPPMGIEIDLVDGCVVVKAGGREVAREFADDPDDWLFVNGPWVQAVEEISEALPVAA